MYFIIGWDLTLQVLKVFLKIPLGKNFPKYILASSNYIEIFYKLVFFFFLNIAVNFLKIGKQS